MYRQPQRNDLRLMTIAVTLLSLPFGASCSVHPSSDRNASAPGGSDSVLRVGFITSGGTQIAGPEGWAQHTGRLARELRSSGVQSITLTGFPNGPDLNEALASGALDLGMLGDTPAIVAHAAGIPTHAINQSSVGMNVWLVTKKDGPRTVEELSGKSVATSKGSYMSRYLIGLLAEKGLTNSVKFVHLLPSDAEPALLRGDIAAYASPSGPLLLSHGFRAIDEARLHPGLTGSSITVVTDSYLAKHPKFPKQWNQIRAEAISEIKRQPDAYYQFEAQTIKLPLNIVKATYPLTAYTPQPFTRAGLQLLDGTKQFLVSQRLAKSDFALSDWTGDTSLSGAKVMQASAP